MPPLVTVITPTWHRHEVLIERCIPSVQDQTYPNLEHVVVSDGPGEELAWAAPGLQGVAYFELDTHDPSVRWGIRARLRALELAHGDIIVNLDDDDALRPHCVAALVEALDGTDFAYGQVFKHAELTPGYVWCSGILTPGGVPTTGLAFRRDTPARFGAWRLDDPTTDWPMVMRWALAGASWAFVQDVLAEAF